MQKISVGEFLEQNDCFTFHLREYLESLKYFSQLKPKFKAFKNSFDKLFTIEELWLKNKTIIQNNASPVPIYSGIDWNKRNYWDLISYTSKDLIRQSSGKFLNPKYCVK